LSVSRLIWGLPFGPVRIVVLTDDMERRRWQKVYAFMETLLAFLGSALGIAALCFAGGFAIDWYLLWRSRRKLSQS